MAHGVVARQDKQERIQMLEDLQRAALYQRLQRKAWARLANLLEEQAKAVLGKGKYVRSA